MLSGKHGGYMAQKEYHDYALKCECGNVGTAEFWEWENPMHHNSDFKSYYSSSQGDFKHIGDKCFECGSARDVSLVPKGPNGQKRPADAIGLAVMIGKIATGEIEDTADTTKSAAAQLGSLGGKKRAANMTPERRSEIAKAAAAKRWGQQA
jgi:hypothetical protein